MTSRRSPLSSFHTIVFIILLVAGGPFLLIGLSEANQTRQTIDTFVSARGTVVDNIYQLQNEGDSSSGAYYPVIEFKPNDGPATRFTDGVGALPPDYEVGAQVEVLYNPADVHDAQLNSWMRLWFAPTLLAGIGVVPASIYLLVLATMRLSGSRRI